MIKVEVWSDINCPFCYIGKRHLEAALKKFKDASNVVVEWKSFELDPYANPAKGESNTDLLAKKYGQDREEVLKLNENITKMARAAGLDFHMSKVIPSNSFNAHRLLHFAKTKGKQNQLMERIFSLKFIEVKNINDNETLRAAALEVGLNVNEVQEVLESDKFGDDIRKDEDQAGALGIRSVPYFIFNKEQSLSGARSVDVFLKMLQESARFKVSKDIEF